MKQRAFAVVVDFVLRAAAGFLLASPVVASVASSGITRFPEGDRLLFEPGGLMLVEVARSLFTALVPLVRAELVMSLVLAIGLVVPYSLLLAASSRRTPSTQSELWGRAVTRVPPLVALHGLTLLAQGAVILTTATLGLQLRTMFVGATSRGADGVLVGVGVLGGGVVLGLAVLRDLASAACAEESLDSRAAITRGFATLTRAAGGVIRGAGLALGAGLSLVLAGAALASLIDVSRPGAWRVALVLLVHQAVLFGRSVCRAFWLARAVRLAGGQLAATR